MRLCVRGLSAGASAFLMALLVGACVTPEQQLQKYAEMSNEDIEAKVVMTNDALDGYAMAHSRAVEPPLVVFGGTNRDVFARGYRYPDGRVVIQFYFSTESSDWLFPRSLNLSQPQISLNVTQVSSDVHCSTAGCRHYEDVVAEIPKSVVRQLVAKDAPEGIVMRLKTKSGRDVDHVIRKAEVRAVLKALGLLKS